MRSWRKLLVAGALACAADAATLAQQPSSQTPFLLPQGQPPARPSNSAPFLPQQAQQPSRYAVTPQAGDWLVCVQTFKGEQARILAEEMVEVLIRDYRLNAFLYDRAHKQRMEEEARVEKIRQQHWENIRALRSQGIDAVDSRFRYRTMDFPDEYAVLVGKPGKNFKEMDAARDFLDDLRKLKPPPVKFASSAAFAETDPLGKGKDRPTAAGYINPFKTAMVAHNPSIPLKSEQQNPDVADDFLKALNADEKYSVLECRKPWTLVVKVYQGQTTLQAPKSPSIMKRLGLAKSEPEILNASAAQAHSTAEFLRKMNPSFEAYVMHHRSYSLVAVGQYDGPNDPNLLAAQRSLAGLQLKNGATGAALETLNAQPLPMKIPR